MNIINHDGQNNVSYLMKKVIVENDTILCISAATVFGLTDSGSKSYKDLASSWLEPIIDNILGFDTFWDLGLPKGVAEFLVFGLAHSAKPVDKLEVSVSVGSVSKQLSVFGDRVWTESGISAAKLFTKMPINYTNAFGGENYQLNPVGKGYWADIFNGILLPNIELPQQLITAKIDRPEIAGFEPYPISYPQRHFLNSFNLNADILKLESGVMPIHFNSAPIDQWVKGFFNGDEEIEIRNMHRELPIIHSRLPGIRFRAFAVRQNPGSEDMFLELETQADTLWLIPNMDCGILVFRATCPTSGIEADDIQCIYCVMEDLHDDPKPVQYYLDYVLSKFKMVQNNTKETDGIASISVEKSPIQPVNEEEWILELIRNAAKGLLPDKPGIDLHFREMLGRINEIITQFKITEYDIKKFIESRKQSGLPISPTEEEIIEDIREVWEKDPQIEASLRQKMEALKAVRLELLEQVGIHNRV